MKISKKNILVIMILAGGILGSHLASAGVLLGSDTLNNTDDLTLIQDGSGNVLEFLDLSVTTNLSVSTAVSTYSSDGFHWATGGEVSELYDAFNITYSVTFNTVTSLGASIADASNYMSYLGTTTTNASLGWIDDLTTSSYHTYSCISTGTCGPNSFTYNTSSFWPTDNVVGVFLVRDGGGTVPEPATLALMGLGLAGIGYKRRRKAA